MAGEEEKTGAPPWRRRLAALSALAGHAGAGAVIAEADAARQAEGAYPPQGLFLEVEGVRLHYVDTGGPGSPVLLLHGNGAMIADLEISGLVAAAGRRHRVLVFDRPGFGHSQRPAGRNWGPRQQARLFHAALARIGLARVAVFGHSWGTLVALALAEEFPASVSGLVLAAGFYFPEARADVAALSVPALPVVGGLLRHTLGPVLVRKLAPRAIARMFAPRPVPEGFTARFPLALAARPSQFGASSEELRLMNSAAADLSRGYARLAAPLVIVAGAEDALVDTERQSATLAREVPGAAFIRLPGMGHMLHHFESELLARLIGEAAPEAKG